MSKKKTMPVLKHQCGTCPFREGAKPEHAMVRGALTDRVLGADGRPVSHICHQTGSGNAFHSRTGKQAALCRGARNLQLNMFATIGFIKEATDEAWNVTCLEMGLPLVKVLDKPLPSKKRKKIKPEVIG